MAQLEHIEAIEKRLWSSADTLRSNSNDASNAYFMPVIQAERMSKGRRYVLKTAQGAPANDHHAGARV